jgi:hypothetical protein
MSTRIALRTTQIPPVTSPHQEIIAIIDLTPERALELLELMQEITMRASASSTTFRISSFERAALYAPACTLTTLPSQGDFVVLPPDYTVTATTLTPIKLVHTNVMPLFINWTAIDQNDRFLINSTELTVELLKAVACGFAIPPGATRQSLRNLHDPASEDSNLIYENTWLH